MYKEGKIKAQFFIFLVAILLLFANYIWLFNERKSNSNHQKNVELIQYYIQKQKNNADKIIREIISQYHQSEQQWITNIQRIVSQNSNDFVHIAVYKNDTAIFWTQNDFIPEILPKNRKEVNAIFFNNTWAYISHKDTNKYTIAAFVPIKKQYPFENKYLKNYYYGNISLNSDYNFSLFPEASSYYITDTDGSLIFSLTPVKRIYSSWNFVLFILLIASSLLLLHVLLLNIHKHKWVNVYVLVLFAAVLILRFIMQYTKMPDFIYNNPLFSAEIFTSNFIFSSLGDAFFNSWMILLLNEYFLLRITRLFVKSRTIRIIAYGIWAALVVLWIYVWNSLVYESSIRFELYHITDINLATIISYIIIGLLCWIYFRNAIFFFSYHKKFAKKYVPIVPLFSLLISTGLFVWVDAKFSFALIFFFLCGLFFWYIEKRNLWWLFVGLLLVSIFIVLRTLQLYNHKKENLQQVVAVSLSNEKDVVAQMLFSDLEKRIRKDKILQSLLNKAYDNRYEIYKYLRENYLYGFWNKYDLQVTICSNFDNLRLLPSGTEVRCFDYFNKIIQTKGTSIEAEHFYSINQDYGEISYLGKFCFPYFIASDTAERCIFLELTSKLIANTPGYPDLLMDIKTYNNLNLQWQNYAKYKNNKLIQAKGNISYPQEYNFSRPSVGEHKIIRTSNHIHYVYAPNTTTLIVVSSFKTQWYQYIWAVLYLFNLYAVVFIIFWSAYYFLTKKHNLFYGFRFKYISSFLIILLSSYILIAIYTLMFFKYRYYQKNTEQLLAKNQTMLNFLEEQAGDWKKLMQMSSSELTKLLISTSNIHYSDINIYLPNGLLYATSRPEFFEKGLKSKLIDADVFTQIVKQKQSQYIHNEKIGTFDYLSSYTALTDNEKLIGILQFPYFTEQEKFQAEINSVLVNLINIYVLFVFLSLGVILIVANSILKPLTYLQTYFKKIRFVNNIQPIEYHQHDEIKPLVNEYNRMLEELARSTEKLLLSERESAWRDIARQIAHEIKNPLTPMKLNIQYLLKQKKEKGYIPDEMLQRTMRILLEQIESLASIASAFSTFARMPSPSVEEFDIIDEIKKAIHLFSNSETEIKFLDNGIAQCTISADKEYIQRILNNLITNAIQAIPPNREKDISVSISQQNNAIILAVKDNGIGISEDIAPNIFKPSFTTKSSGMGMGLSLVKNMVEMMHGKIYFTSSYMQGTTFYVELPIVNITYHE
ncbi:MAG: ATP-binding protein [Bacteroidales bacterium]|nr:ATP-binding protein [Bacteroidales bacterium]